MSPIRPENRDRYGDDWPEFSRSIRFDRAGGRCECEGECSRGTHQGRCPNQHGQPAYGTGSKVVLTVAHLCHTPECRKHVKAMCQGCHLHYDREHHAMTRSAIREATIAAAGQGYLIPINPEEVHRWTKPDCPTYAEHADRSHQPIKEEPCSSGSEDASDARSWTNTPDQSAAPTADTADAGCPRSHRHIEPTPEMWRDQ